MCAPLQSGACFSELETACVMKALPAYIVLHGAQLCNGTFHVFSSGAGMPCRGCVRAESSLAVLSRSGQHPACMPECISMADSASLKLVRHFRHLHCANSTALQRMQSAPLWTAAASWLLSLTCCPSALLLRSRRIWLLPV